jgi:hypothetical protein
MPLKSHLKQELRYYPVTLSFGRAYFQEWQKNELAYIELRQFGIQK